MAYFLFSFMEIQYASAHLPAIFYDVSLVFLAEKEEIDGTGRNVSCFVKCILRIEILAKTWDFR